MSETWNLETVADSKSEAPPETPLADAAPAIPSVLSNDHSLGAIMTIAREARGFSREQAAKASSIPAYYLTMIETDDYSSIADQLYLLPFLRRYAAFVNLEPEEVASRFIRDVQRADMNPGRPSEPIAMFAPRKPFPWGIVIRISFAVVAITGAWFGYRYFIAHKSATATAKPSMAVEQAVPEGQRVAPKAAGAAPAPMTIPSIAMVPATAASVAHAPAAVTSPAVAPAAVASSAVVSARVAHPVASAPLGTSAPKSSGHSAAPGSSSSPSRSSSGRPRGSIRSSSTARRLSVQN